MSRSGRRSRSVLLLLGLLAGVAGGPGAAAAEAGRRAPGLVAVDAAGRVLGAAWPLSGNPAGIQAALKVDGQVVLVSAGRDRLLGGSAGILFEAADCGSEPLVQDVQAAGLSPLLPFSGVGPGGILYRAIGAPSPRMIASGWNGFAVPPEDPCVAFAPAPFSVFEAVETLNPADLRFPLRLR